MCTVSGLRVCRAPSLGRRPRRDHFPRQVTAQEPRHLRALRHDAPETRGTSHPPRHTTSDPRAWPASFPDGRLRRRKHNHELSCGNEREVRRDGSKAHPAETRGPEISKGRGGAGCSSGSCDTPRNVRDTWCARQGWGKRCGIGREDGPRAYGRLPPLQDCSSPGAAKSSLKTGLPTLPTPSRRPRLRLRLQRQRDGNRQLFART